MQDSTKYDDSVPNRILVAELSGKAMSYAFLTDYNKALEYSNKALELDPNSEWALIHQAWAMNGLEKLNADRITLDQACEAVPILATII